MTDIHYAAASNFRSGEIVWLNALFIAPRNMHGGEWKILTNDHKKWLVIVD